MKETITKSIKLILEDRLMTVLVAILLLVCIGYCIYVGVSLRPSDLQVAVRYTAFGETNFYREKWYYLITFIIFGVLIGGLHSILAVKLYAQGRRQIALAFILLSLLLVLIAWIVTWSILRVAFL